MVDFNQFVTSLGPDAKKYTEEELQQLYGEVLRFADLLLMARQTTKTTRRVTDRPSTGGGLDGGGQDRTVKTSAQPER